MRILLAWILTMTATIAVSGVIEDAQRMLNGLGYKAGVADGIYGTKTARALEEFYKSKKSVYDGRLDANEIADLSEAFNSDVKFCAADVSKKTELPVKFAKFDLDQLFSKISTPLPRYQAGTVGRDAPISGNIDIQPIITSVADINLDGISDILVEYIETMVPPLIFLGTRSGKFEQIDELEPSAARRHIREGYFSDFNLDGFPDFVGFTTSDHTEYFKKEGINHFKPGESDLLLINQGGTTFEAYSLPAKYKNDVNHGGIVSDIDGDGLIDIISLSEDDRKATFPVKNLGQNNFALSKKPLPALVTQSWVEDGEAGDLNRDGYDDYVISLQKPRERRNYKRLDTENTLAIILGDGDFDFTNNKIYKVGEYWFDTATIEDLRHFDSKKEGKNISVKNVAFGTGNIEIVDIEGDGDLDIIEAQYLDASRWSTSGFNVYINTDDCFVNLTESLFPHQVANRTVKGSRYTSYVNNFYFEDLNDDGKKDLLLQSMSHRNRTAEHGQDQFPFIFLQQKNGVFLPVNNSSVDGLQNLGDMVSGDFNGDGKTDIAGTKWKKIDGVESIDIITYFFNPKANKNFEFFQYSKNFFELIPAIKEINVKDGKLELDDSTDEEAKFSGDVKYSVGGITFSEWLDIFLLMRKGELISIRLDWALSTEAPTPFSKFRAVFDVVKTQCGKFPFAADDGMPIILKSNNLEELNLQKCYNDVFKTNLSSKEYEQYVTLIKSSKTLLNKLRNTNSSLQNYFK